MKLGNWLSQHQAQTLLLAPGEDTLKGLRDTALLAVMLGAGLRRSELAGLTVEHVQQREGRWVIVDLVGKHGRVRSVPIASWVKSALDRWTAAAEIGDGCVFRAINKGDRVTGAGMTAQTIYNILADYAGAMGLVKLRALAAGAAVDQRRKARWARSSLSVREVQLFAHGYAKNICSFATQPPVCLIGVSNRWSSGQRGTFRDRYFIPEPVWQLFSSSVR